jgi:Anti-sigma-28 factor, FlgM
MAMRISSEINIPQALETGPGSNSSSPLPSSATGALPPDTSALSSSGANVLALATAVHQFPEIRQSKVAALAEQVRAGAYVPQPAQSAEALMSSMRLPSAA